MAEEIVTTKQHVDGDVFQVPAGVPRREAVEFAETALEACRGLMGCIIREEQDGPDIAWAARFLIECALTCYRATGRGA